MKQAMELLKAPIISCLDILILLSVVWGSFLLLNEPVIIASYPITVTAPHDTTAINVTFAGQALHCFFLD